MFAANHLAARWLASISFACLITWQLTASIARAQPSKIDKDTARTLLRQGDERIKRNDFEGALAAYKHADSIMGVPTTGIEVGRLNLKLGRLVEAMTAFQRVTRHTPRRDEPPPFTMARKSAHHHIKELRPRIPKLTLAIDGEQLSLADVADSIAVLIDGAPVTNWQLPFMVNPGRHEVVVALVGYNTASKSVELRESERRSLKFHLAREAVEAPPAAADSPSTSGSWFLAYGGFAGSAIFGAAGAVTGVLSLNDAAEVNEQCVSNACPPSAEEQLTRSRTLAHVSTSMFVLTGLAAASGVVGLTLALGDDDTEMDGGRDEEEQARSSQHTTVQRAPTLVFTPNQVRLKLRF